MSATQESGRTGPEIRLYQDLQAVSNYLRAHAKFDSIQDHLRNAQIWRLSAEIAAEKIDEDVYEIIEAPVWSSARAHYVAQLPDGFRKRFLIHFWDLSATDLSPRRVKHTVRVQRWVEHPTQGVPKQSIEDTMGFWV